MASPVPLRTTPGRPPRLVALGILGALACSSGGGTGPTPTTTVSCETPTVIALAPGAHRVIDPTSSKGCVRISASGAVSEYLVALVSGAGAVSEGGVSGTYALRANAAGSFAAGAAAVPAPAPSLDLARDAAAWPTRFHLALRESEQRLAADPRTRPAVAAAPPIAAVPVVGTERLFRVCKNLQCSAFDSVTAVARVVESRVAVYLDKVVPTFDTLRQADLEDLARTFTTYHYPINAAAFGAESDRDANGVVVILLTDAVNALTTDCTNGRILGFFWGGDLLNVTGSNQAEVFYAMVPAPATGSCTSATRKATLDRIKPTLIHEFQHMINFNQRVLVRNGGSEATWLNEALSHLSEELAGRLIPNTECVGFSSCRSQYSSGNLFNAWDFLADTEAEYLVSPRGSNGTLEERGAGWLFLRYLVDQHGTDSLGGNVTRGLVQTTQVGSQNVAAVTGVDFATQVAEWMLTTYVDDLAGFTPASQRLTYSTWGFRKVFLDNCCTTNAPFARAFPTVPVVINPASFPFLQAGTLRGGSGRHFTMTVPGGTAGVDLVLSKPLSDLAWPAIDPALSPRLAVVRLR